jgi:signal transduction histidine kinase
LGLSLSKMLAQLHGGTIWVTANPEGAGSIFYFAFPVDQQTDQNGITTDNGGPYQ